MTGFFHAYLSNASLLLENYKQQEPFAVYLKNFFKRNKKFGSRDRKVIGDLCYGFWRMGNSVTALSITEAIVAGFFMTHQEDNGLLEAQNPILVAKLKASPEEKLQFLSTCFPALDANQIFPALSELSPAIEHDAWVMKHFNMPAVFLRIRPGRKKIVQQKLDQSEILCELIGERTIRLEKNAALDAVLSLDKDCVVQDIASQQSGDILEFIPHSVGSFWDACAASGGKSLLVHDRFPGSSIYVSDLREDVLDELNMRFSRAGLAAKQVFCNDLTNPLSAQVIRSVLPEEGVDLIIADVPCTGSGTWSRSPEWLTLFDVDDISVYSRLQRKIMDQLCKQVKPGKSLLYITCSVYREENEGMVEYVLAKGGFDLIAQRHLNGEAYGGDHLFSALFTSVS